jgi:hypothetical protein
LMMTHNELVLFAEEHRTSLPIGFDGTAEELTVLMQRGAPITATARGAAGPLNIRIKDAVVLELRDLLCTDSVRYADVRTHGHVVSRASLASIAAYVAGALGITAGAATACVAFVALAVAKVGSGAFCRLTAVEAAGDLT